MAQRRGAAGDDVDAAVGVALADDGLAGLVVDALQTGSDERVIGFVHIGTPSAPAPDRPRPDVARLISEYSGPWKG